MLPHLTVRYPEDLPVSSRRQEIAEAISRHQVVVVAGETGSGKTTQLPKICLEMGRGPGPAGGGGRIGHTQPRRLAARTVAERIADELDTTLGDIVGYKVRFTDQVGESSRVKVMTDGILLAEIARDRELRAYDTLIIDEAHERSLNVDFLLGYLRGLLPRRPDLKVVITSATIDTARFAAHFADPSGRPAPVIEVTGRSFPVEVRYRPPGDADGDPVQGLVDAVHELFRHGPGDVLVFCSGERDIRDAADALTQAGAGPDPTPPEILPLYARLSIADQHRVFAPHRGRRVVLATNVAETSLTVPGIRSVVDPGLARISRYSRRTKVQRLPIEPISQASANQRAGRCGRVGPGVCIRLYPEEDLAARPAFTDPEILRTNLASVILSMADIGLGDIADFGFLDPPDPRSIADGIALLTELGALRPAETGDEPPRLTKIGRQLARLPVDPRLGRMVVEAERRGALREVTIIAAALSIQDPREHPSEHAQAASEAHARFADRSSDFLSLLALWDHVTGLQRELSGNQFRKRCRAEYLNFLRVREWQDIAAQIRHVLRERGVRANRQPATPAAIHRSLLAGLLSQVGLREGEARQYIGARQVRFAIAGGTPLAKKPPPWVMAGELVETNRLWARRVARINPDWVESAAGHLLKRSHGDPVWHAERGASTVVERATLYGIPIVTDRQISYARIDQADARDLFIERALVEADWAGRPTVVDDNHAVLDDVSARRRSGAGSDAELLFRFYDAQLPADITSGQDLERWIVSRPDDPLTLTPEMLNPADDGALDPDAFPDWWAQGDLRLSLTYTWQPGDADDGVTVTVPIGAADRVDPAPFEWQVPGLRHELVVALIRSLPKALRRHVVPAPEYATAFLADHGPGDGDLIGSLAQFLASTVGEPIRPGAFSWSEVPGHLRPHFVMVDQQGRKLGSADDLAFLLSQIDGRLRRVVVAGASAMERTGLVDWDVGELPAVVSRRWSGHQVSAWVSLVDEGSSVAVRVFDDEVVAAGAMWGGTRRLLSLVIPTPGGAVRRRLGIGPRADLALLQAPGGQVGALVEDCILAAVDRLLSRHGGPVRDRPGWDRLRADVAADLPSEAEAVAGAAARVLAAKAAVATRLGSAGGEALEPSQNDVRRQVDSLVRAGFVSAGPDRLDDIARYLRAAVRRLEVLGDDPDRDRRRMLAVLRLAAEARAISDPVAADRVRWLIEELRVSLWAQALGTAVPVSEARVRRAIADAV